MVAENIEQMRLRARRALIPPARIPLSEWIEQEIKLPASLTSLPGAVHLYPFQRGMADAMSDPRIDRVTVVKSARIGYTTLLVGVLGNYIVNEPAPILFVLPTEKTCREFVTFGMEPTFEESPALAAVLSQDGRESRNRILSRRFAGGSLNIVAAQSPRNLRAHNARILIMDEVDGMEVTREGPPVWLAEYRTKSFPDRKIIIGSTPIDAETSPVLAAYERSDKRIFEVPCIECGDFHEIQWKDIRWPEGKPEEAHWCCPSCGSIVEERWKFGMVKAGRWRATAPHVRGHAGFKVNALVSSLANATWAILAAEFLAAKSDPQLLKTFINLALGEGWQDNTDEIDDLRLAESAEAFSLQVVPAEVLSITLGVDVQDDRLEGTFIGWDRHGKAYVLDHHIIWGRADDETTWRELDEVLKWTFPHPHGGRLRIDATAIDSGDGDTMEIVYAFAFPRANRRVLAVKGVAGPRPFITRSKQKVKGGWLWIVGVDGIKTHILSRLKHGGMIRFSDQLEPSWYEQLTAERSVVRYTRGQPRRTFERIKGRRAEGLDCTVYAFAAHHHVGNINWSAREEELRNPAPVEVAQRPVRPTVIRSAWMDQ